MLEKIYNPLAENFDNSSEIYQTKSIPNNNIKISILNSRWDSMNRISKLLEEEFTKKSFVNKIDTYKINHSEPTEEDLLNHVTDWSHFAILGLANWGACTAWSCHDGSEILKRGVKTILLVTEAFEDLAKITLESRGVAELPYYIFPHQTEQLSTKELKPYVEDFVEICISKYIFV